MYLHLIIYSFILKRFACLGLLLYLGEHGLAVLRDHGALIAVYSDAGVVEGLFGVFQDVVEIWHATLKHRAEVSGDEGPPDCWGGKQDVTYIALYFV